MNSLWVTYLLITSIVLGLILLLRFKSLLLRYVLFVYWYPLVTMLLFCLDFPLGGLLDLLGRSAYVSIAREATWLAVLGYYVFLIPLWPVRRAEVKLRHLKINGGSRILLVVILGIVSVLAFPKAFGIGDQRWNLIPGPWAVLFIALNAILILSQSRTARISTIIHLILIGISIAGGERVNAIGTAFLILVLIPVKPERALKVRNIDFRTSIVLGAIGVLAIYSSFWRYGNFGVSAILIFYNVISLATVNDVVHIYFSGFSYYMAEGNNLRPLINQLASLLNLPVYGGGGLGHEYNFTEILRDYIWNNGGGLFYTEGLMIFGFLGVPIFSGVYAAVLRLSISSGSMLFSSVVFVVLLILQMRVQWYGLTYTYMPLFAGLILVSVLCNFTYRKWRTLETLSKSKK